METCTWHLAGVPRDRDMEAGLKKRIFSRVLAVLGCALVIMSPAWRFGIAPLFIRLPDDLYNSSVQKGRLTVYADRATSRFYPPGEEAVTRLLVENRDVGVPSISDARILVVDERVTLRDVTTGRPVEGLREPTTYVLDRRTCENVPGVIEGIDRTGHTIKFPMLSQKKPYELWDDDLERTVTARFVKTGRLDGNRVKGVGVFIYQTDGQYQKMVKPPLGVPEYITGKKAKEMSGNPDLPVPDDAEMKIGYYKKTDATMYVEPKTGTVLYTPSYKWGYYVKNAPGGSPEYVKIAEFDRSTDPASMRGDIDDGQKYRRLIDLDLKWTPLSFLLWGTALIGIGILVKRRSGGGRGSRGSL